MSELKSFAQVVTQIREFLSGLNSRQRMFLGGGALLFAIVLFTFVHLLSSPTMTPLYSNMEAADAQALGQRLTAKNIRFQISPDGKSVLVPADQIDTARMEIASQGAPHSGRLGFELFDNANWATSDFDDKVKYQRALEGELERTIQSMGNVAAARVHVVIPAESIYSGQERQAKAAVILKLKDHHLSAPVRVAVQRLVSSAVDKLDAQNVTVVDAEADGSAGAVSAQSAGAERGAEEVLADRLVQTLSPVLGADHVRVTVHTEFDPSTVEEQQEAYDPEKTVALSMQRTEETSGGTQPAGAAGTASNVPGGGSPAKTNGGESLALSKSENGTYAVNKVVRHTTQPAGRIKRIAVAVLVDDACVPGSKCSQRQRRSPEELKSIEELAKASVGFDPTRGDALSVQNMSFQVLPVEMPAAPTKLEKVRTTLLNWSRLVRIGCLLLIFLVVYVAVLRPVKNEVLQILASSSRGMLPSKAIQGKALARASDSIEISEERPKAARVKEEIAARVKQEPVSASRLVQGWIRDGDRA